MNRPLDGEMQHAARKQWSAAARHQRLGLLPSPYPTSTLDPASQMQQALRGCDSSTRNSISACLRPQPPTLDPEPSVCDVAGLTGLSLQHTNQYQRVGDRGYRPARTPWPKHCRTVSRGVSSLPPGPMSATPLRSCSLHASARLQQSLSVVLAPCTVVRRSSLGPCMWWWPLLRLRALRCIWEHQLCSPGDMSVMLLHSGGCHASAPSQRQRPAGCAIRWWQATEDRLHVGVGLCCLLLCGIASCPKAHPGEP